MTDRESKAGATNDEIRVKVTDRRKFNKAGELRDDAPAENEPTTGAGSATPGPAQDAAAGGGPPAGEKAARPAGDPREAKGKPAGVDFQSFVYFLYMSALHELGVPTQPGEPARAADLERARFFVDVLQLLESKTAGNLEPGETKLLEEALYNLRMQYVGVSQGRPD